MAFERDLPFKGVLAGSTRFISICVDNTANIPRPETPNASIIVISGGGEGGALKAIQDKGLALE